MSKSPIFPSEENCEHYDKKTVISPVSIGQRSPIIKHYEICTYRTMGRETVFPFQPSCSGCKIKCDLDAFGLVES